MKSVVGNLEYSVLVFQFLCNPQYIKQWAAKYRNSYFILYVYMKWVNMRPLNLLCIWVQCWI